jgi:hypothetical protein
MDYQQVVLVSWQQWQSRWMDPAYKPMVAWRSLRGTAACKLNKPIPASVVYPTVLQHCLQECVYRLTAGQPRYLHCGQLVVKVLTECMGVMHTADYTLSPGDFSIISGRLDQLVGPEFRYLPERLLFGEPSDN